MSLKAQNDCDNFWDPTLDIGIHTQGMTGDKPLHIKSWDDAQSDCNDPAIKLEFSGQPAYSGYLSLLTPYNLDQYTKLLPPSQSPGDLILSADQEANDIILTTLSDDGFLKFATTNPGATEDYERMRITNRGRVALGFEWHIEPDLLPQSIFDVQVHPWYEMSRIMFAHRNEPEFELGGAFPSIRIYSPCDQPDVAAPWWFESSQVDGITNGVLKFKSTDACMPIGEEDPDVNPASTLKTKVAFWRNGSVSINYDPEANPSWTGARLLIKASSDGPYGNSLKITNSNDVGIFNVRDDAQVRIGSETIISGSHTDYKLSVDGRIVAEEMIVTLSDWGAWPDYIFDVNYALPDLYEVESFIKENKHLPGIPNKEEVDKDGINVGDMQAKLLKKVEELTLYVIELKKENEELRKLIKDK